MPQAILSPYHNVIAPIFRLTRSVSLPLFSMSRSLSLADDNSVIAFPDQYLDWFTTIVTYTRWRWLSIELSPSVYEMKGNNDVALKFILKESTRRWKCGTELKKKIYRRTTHTTPCRCMQSFRTKPNSYPIHFQYLQHTVQILCKNITHSLGSVFLFFASANTINIFMYCLVLKNIFVRNESKAYFISFWNKLNTIRSLCYQCDV